MSEPDRAVQRFTVRRVTRPDARLLSALQALESEAFGHLGLRAYDLAVVAEAGMLLVGSVGDEIVGGCQLLRMLDEPGAFFVVGFYVRPGWRGRGLGETLLQAVIEEARVAGAESLLLTVAADNSRALSVYEKAGFGIEEFVRDLYGDGEHRHLLRRRFGQGDLHGSV